MKTTQLIEEKLTGLIKEATSPFHCCQYCMEQLKKEGFKELSLTDEFSIKPGEKYAISVFDGTLIAFQVGSQVSDRNYPKLRMITAHTDWPGFVLKPNPDMKTDNYIRLNTEPYGGAVYHSFVDRPLGIAGKVCMKSQDVFHPRKVLYDSKKPLAIIPGLAIHMDREINTDLKLNPQTQLLPLWSLSGNESDSDFMEYLANELSCPKEDILDYELFFYNNDKPSLLGAENSLYSAPRIDNCSGVLATLEAICRPDISPDSICVAAFYHNEEIGNQTKQGAASNLTNQILERIFHGLSLSKEALYCSMTAGFCLSLDVAHGHHPGYTEKSDPTNRACLGEGLCIKLSARQSYTTDAAYISILQGICEKEDIPYKKFVNRSDMRGGSTLGTVVSAALNIPCVDAGVPLLSMHSARELIAIKDQQALCSLAESIFTL